MKYIYIICAALSSFFTYNSLSANTHTYQNAFFIPGGAFQQNTSVKDIAPKRFHQSQPAGIKQPTTENSVVPTKQSTANTIKKTQQTANTPSKQLTQQKTKPVKTVTQKPTQQIIKQVAQPAKQKTASKKTAKYKLDDSPVEPQQPITTAAPELSSLEKFQQKSLKEMLDTLPYPDSDAPKFKQIYALYALELRSTYRRGKLPSNYEQEEILAKADSIRRFDVK